MPQAPQSLALCFFFKLVIRKIISFSGECMRAHTCSTVVYSKCVCVCVCVCVTSSAKWQVEDHVLAEAAKESGCFARRSCLAASVGRVLRRLMEPHLACRGFSPAKSAAPRTVMDHRAPATRACVFALLKHLPPHPLDLAWLTSGMPTTDDNCQVPNGLQTRAI